MDIDINVMLGEHNPVLPELERMLSTRQKVTIDQALAHAADILKRHVINGIKAHIAEEIQAIYDTYCMINGPFDPQARLYKTSTWIEGLDDTIEKFFEDYQGSVTAGWLGEHVVDTNLYEPDAIIALADSFAENAWSNMAYLHKRGEEGKPKTSAQILSMAGILRADIEALLDQRIEPTPEAIKGIHMSTLEEAIVEAIVRINSFVNMAGYDAKTIKSHLDNATDGDTGIAASGLHFLGAELTDKDALQTGAMIYGVDALANLIMTGTPGAAAIAAPKPPKPVVTVNGGKTIIPAQALELIKEHTGVKVEKLGEGVGVSRATFENYVKGKAGLRASPEAYNFLSEIIRTHVTALTTAQTMLDASQQMPSAPPQ